VKHTSATTKFALAALIAVLTVVLTFSNVPLTHGQNFTNFTSADKFAIPNANATINFALCGSYQKATLENDTWVFQNLSLNDSQLRGNLKFSAENSNVTIFTYQANNPDFRSSILTYSAQGQGKQTINFGLNRSQSSSTEWMVATPGAETFIFLAEGEEWTLLPDNTVVVTGLTGNVTVVHFNFITPVDTSNLPFYQQHSVAIATASLVVITVAVALVVKVKKKPSGEIT
jgi:hypothetical protein